MNSLMELLRATPMINEMENGKESDEILKLSYTRVNEGRRERIAI